MNVLLRSLLTLSLSHDDAYTNAVTCLFSFIPTKYYEIYIYEKQEARHLMRFSFFLCFASHHLISRRDFPCNNSRFETLLLCKAMSI